MVLQSIAKRAVRTALPKPLLLRVRQRLAARRRAAFPRRVVYHTYCGHEFAIEIADPTAEAWYDRDWERLPEIELLAEGRLRRGAVVFNLGAHQGVVALVLARAAGAAGRVIAVEADRDSADIARRNVERNEVQQVEVIHAAVTAASGRVRFGADGAVAAGEGEWGTAEVDAVSVDDLARRYGFPDVMFIDVEGYEVEALRGAGESLRRAPDVFVEVHEPRQLARFGGSLSEVIAAFPRDRFELFSAPPTSTTEFLRLDQAPELFGGRFFLVARALAPHES
jgi:FkbM family methyltransferase